MASKRKSYSAFEKLEVLRKFRDEYGGNCSKASRELNVSRKMIKDWEKNEQNLADLDRKKMRRRLPGAGRRPFAPKLEEALFSWFKNQRKNKLIVNYLKIREEAKRLQTQMDEGHNVKFSDKWIASFCKRHKIR